jgi:myo-inositol-1-phosphate synthase
MRSEGDLFLATPENPRIAPPDGVEAIKRGLGLPVGSLTQMGTIRLGKHTDNRVRRMKDFFLDQTLLDKVKEPLSAITPMKAVFDHGYVKRITGANVKESGSKMDKTEMLMQDIEDVRRPTDASRLVMIWWASTEVFHKPRMVHRTLRNFECGLQKNDPDIAPSQIYAYAALKSGVPFANGAANLTTDMPALLELA